MHMLKKITCPRPPGIAPQKYHINAENCPTEKSAERMYDDVKAPYLLASKCTETRASTCFQAVIARAHKVPRRQPKYKSVDGSSSDVNLLANHSFGPFSIAIAAIALSAGNGAAQSLRGRDTNTSRHT
jgi:hypothetical protein